MMILNPFTKSKIKKLNNQLEKMNVVNFRVESKDDISLAKDIVGALSEIDFDKLCEEAKQAMKEGPKK